MVTLAIDSSNKAMAIGIVDGNEIKGELALNVQQNHSIQLMPAIQYLMKASHVTPKDVTAIAVAQGPGSYTGLRIGVTVAKTMAWDLNIPLYGISSLKVLAANITCFDGVIVSLLDARRNAVYIGAYRRSDVSAPLETVIEDTYLPMEELVAQLKALDEPVIVVGSHADILLYKTQFEEALSQCVFVEATDGIPSGARLALLSQFEEAQEPHTFVPSYIRMTEAETNWRKAQGLD